MATNGKINFEVGFITNSKGLKELKSELAEIRSMANNADFTAAMDPSKIQSMVKSANDLEYAMNAAFDVDLNTVNIQKFNQILKQSGTDLSTIQQNLAAAGTIGQSAFLKATAGLMQFNTAAKQTNHFLDSIATSFANTIKWSAMSSIINTISSTIQKSYYYVKDLDTALNDIRIVTGKNADEMSRFAESANNAAKALAVTTEDYTKGSLIYYQQGLDDETVKTLTDITAKTSNVTGQSMSAVSEQLTAVWNGYQVANEAAQEGMQVYEEYVDKMAAVGASTASDLQELSTAMSKVASAASAMGVGFDDLNAQIATIVSVTRQAPESVGTALKTIYARLGDLKIEGADEFGVSLGEVSGQLDAIGIHILDTSGQMRNMSDVMAEVAVKWDTWTEAQRQAAAVAMAGKRQYNNLIALFDNWDMYGEALETSMSAAGTLEEQQAIALDSLSNKMDQLKAAAEDLYDSLYDESDIKSLVEGLTDIVQVLADFSDSIGGLINLIPMLGSTAARVFSNQIANGLSTIIINAQNARRETQMMAENANQLKMMFSDSSLFSNTGEEDISPAMEQGVNQLKQYYETMQQYQGIMSAEQKETYNTILNNIAKVGELNLSIEKQTQTLKTLNDKWKEQKGLVEEVNLEEQDEAGLKKRIQNLTKLNSVLNALTEKQSLGFFEAEDIESVNKVFKELGQNADINAESLAKVKNRFDQLYKSGAKIPNIMNTIIDDLKRAGATEGEIAKLTQQMKNLRDGTKEAGESLRNNLDLQQWIGNITNTIGALGQLATSVHTLKNLGSIWNNNDIDTGEKILQTIMNLSFVLPSLISSIQKINTLFGIESTLLRTLTASHTANNAIQAAGLKISGRVTKEKVEEAILQKILNALKIESTEDISAETAAKLINLNATELEKAALEEATIAQNAFNASVLANPYVLVAGAIIAAIGGLVFAYDSYHKKLKEDAELQLERLSSVQKELDANEELYQSYHKLKKDFDDGVDNKDQLKEATLNLCEAYGLEADRLDLLNGKYEKINAQIEEYRKGQLEQQKRTLTSELANTATKAIETSRDTKQDKWDGIDARNIDFGQDDKLDKILSEKVDFYNNGTMLIEANNIKELAQAYNQIKDAQVAYTKSTSEEEQQRSKAFRSMNNWLAEVGPVIESYEALQEQIKNTDAEIVLAEHNFNNVDSLPKYQNEIQAVANELVKLGYSEKEAKEMAETHAAAVTNATETFAQQVDIIKALAKEVHLSEEEVEKFINNLSDEEKEILFSGQVDIDNLKALENVKKAIEIVQDQVNAEDVGIIVSLRDKVTSSKKLSKKEIEEQMGEESKLGQDYEVAMADFDMESKLDQVDILNGMLKDRMELDKEYINNVEEVAAREKALYEERRKNADLELENLKRRKAQILDQQRWRELTEEEEEALKECNQEIAATEVALDSYTKAIEHYQDVIDNGLLPEEISNKIFDDMIAGIDGVISKADVLKDLVSVVGENWTFAAEKIEEFAQNFPEVLRDQENYNVLQDGSIQLTEKGKEILQEQLNLKKQELVAENEVYQEQLQHQADLLYAEAEYYEAQAQNLADYLDGKKSGAEAEAAMAKTEKDFEQKLMNELGMSEQELQQFIQTEYGKTNTKAEGDARDIFNYWCSVGEAAAAAAQAYEFGQFKPPSFNQGTHAASTTSSYKPRPIDQGGYLNLSNVDEIAERQQELVKKAQAARNQADILISKKVASESATQASINAFDNAVSGKGNEKSKDKSKSKKDYKEDEIDRYWEINKALDKIADALKKVDKLKSHVFGKQKIQVLNQEAKLIKQQTKLYEQLYEEQKKEAEELRGKLSAGGMAFNAEGEITNYGEALKSALATYNQAVDQFNAGLINDEGFKIAEQNYENFKKNVDRYDKLFYSEMKETREKIEEEVQKLRDIELEKFEIKLQIKIDKAQLRKDFRNFRKELEKDFTLYYEVLPKTQDFKKNFKDDKAQVKAYMEAAKEVQHEIDIIMAGGTSTMFASLTEAQEKLKEINKSFEEASKNTMQDVEDAWNNYIDMIDQANEKLEQQETRLERVNEKLDSFKQIVELAYGEKAYNKFHEILEQRLYNNQAQVETAIKETETYKKLFEEQIKIEGANRDDMSTWSEAATKYYEEWMDSEQKITDLTAERIQLLKDDYLNTLSQITDEWEKQLTAIETVDEKGNKITISVGFDIAEQEWELAEKQADLFYNSTEKAYQIQTLNNKIQKDIDKSSAASQKKLKAFRDSELAALGKEDVLTKNQVAAAQAKYDILLKQIALEEAQNNKTSMKLTRNSEGNWSYQYVADEGDIQDKQQDLLDSWEKLRSLSQEQMDQAAKDLQTYQKMAIEASEDNEKRFAEGLINEEQYQYNKKMIQEKYYSEPTGILWVLSRDYQEAKENLILGEVGVRQEVYNQDKNNYVQFTEDEKAILDQFRDYTKDDFQAIEDAVKQNYKGIYDETVARMGENGSTYTTWNTATMKMADKWSNNKDGVKKIVTDALIAMQKATSDYKTEVSKTVKQAGLDWDTMKGKIADTKKETDEAKKAVTNYCNEINKKLPNAAKKVQEMIDAWNKVKDSISAASLEIEEYLKKQQDMQMPTAPDTSTATSYGGSSTTSYGGGGNYTPQTPQTTPVTPPKRTGSIIYLGMQGNGMYRRYSSFSNDGQTIQFRVNGTEERSGAGWRTAYPTNRFVIVSSNKRYGLTTKWDNYVTEAFKTGGYTGSWSGSEGRLATLHQKELVLNAQDTENFLAATDSLRDLVSLDSSIEKSIAEAISKMLIHMANANLNNATIPNNNETNTNNVFNINAEFPNANDVTEIREAILSLPNLASQYIHRTGY